MNHKIEVAKAAYLQVIATEIENALKEGKLKVEIMASGYVYVKLPDGDMFNFFKSTVKDQPHSIYVCDSHLIRNEELGDAINKEVQRQALEVINEEIAKLEEQKKNYQ